MVDFVKRLLRQEVAHARIVRIHVRIGVDEGWVNQHARTVGRFGHLRPLTNFVVARVVLFLEDCGLNFLTGYASNLNHFHRVLSHDPVDEDNFAFQITWAALVIEYCGFRIRTHDTRVRLAHDTGRPRSITTDNATALLHVVAFGNNLLVGNHDAHVRVSLELVDCAFFISGLAAESDRVLGEVWLQYFQRAHNRVTGTVVTTKDQNLTHCLFFPVFRILRGRNLGLWEAETSRNTALLLTGQITLAVVNCNVHFVRANTCLPLKDLVSLRLVRIELLTLFGVVRRGRFDEFILRQEVFRHAANDNAHFHRNELAFEPCGFEDFDGLLVAHRVSQHLFHTLVVSVQCSVAAQRLTE